MSALSQNHREHRAVWPGVSRKPGGHLPNRPGRRQLCRRPCFWGHPEKRTFTGGGYLLQSGPIWGRLSGGPPFRAFRRPVRSSSAAGADHGARGAPGRCPAGPLRDHPRSPERLAAACCARLFRSTQDALQSSLRRRGGRERGGGPNADRPHTAEGAPARSQSAEKGALGRGSGRARGALTAKRGYQPDRKNVPFSTVLADRPELALKGIRLAIRTSERQGTRRLES